MKLRNVKTTGETIIGYKKAKNNHLVVLEIPKTAKHNMDRTNIKDKQFAKYRCSEAVVKDIINLNTGESVDEASSIQNTQFKYILGQKVIPDTFDTRLNNVCGGGIHYFLDRQRAVFYNMGKRVGEYKEWRDDGQLHIQIFYKNGKYDGEYKEWHENGQLYIQTFYKNGFREGEYSVWHDNGQLHIQAFYKNDKLEGEYKEWYSNSQLYIQAFYKNGFREGEYSVWHDNGQLHIQAFYKNDKLEGERKEWYSNSQLFIQAFYKNGILQ